MWSKLKSNKWRILQVFLILCLVVSLTVGGLVLKSGQSNDNTLTVGIGQKTITVGTNIAYAAGTPDFTCDGVDDNVQFQLAIDALPAASGGKIVVLSGTYVFAAVTTVTRVLNNVSIEGMGRGTYFTGDGATAIFTAGGNNWQFSNLRTDAGSLSMGATTGWSWENVTINATYYAYRTDDATTAASWNIPTGRGATLVVAASNASAAEKAQADYVCDGIADNVQIQAAIDALAAAGGGTLHLSAGRFNIATGISITSDHIRIEGEGESEHGFFPLIDYGVTALVASADMNVLSWDGTAIAPSRLIGGGIEKVLIVGFTKATGNSDLRLLRVDTFRIDKFAAENNGFGVYISESFAVEFNQTGLILNNEGLRITGAASNGNHSYIGGFIAHNDSDGAIIYGANTWRNRFVGTHFHGNGVGGISGKGLSLELTSYNIVSGCLLTQDLKSDGLALDDSDWNTITGNIIDANLGHGIQVYNSNDNTITGNTITNNDSANAAGYDGIHIINGGGTSSRNLIANNRVSENDRYEIYVESGTNNTVLDNTVIGTDHQGAIVDTGTTTTVFGNKGYVAPSEIRTASGSLTAGNANAIFFAWHDTELQDIFIKKVVIEITTPGGTALSVGQVGIADDAAGTNLGTEFFPAAGINLNANGIYDSWNAGDTGVQVKFVFCQDSASATDGWVVGKILVQNAAALAGRYYIEYTGR